MAQLSDILHTLCRELRSVLETRLDQILLFGSQARGEAHAGSDIDILLVMHDRDIDFGELLQLTSPVIGAISLEHDVVISRAFVSRDRFDHENSPLLLNVRREGVPI